MSASQTHTHVRNSVGYSAGQGMGCSVMHGYALPASLWPPSHGYAHRAHAPTQLRIWAAWERERARGRECERGSIKRRERGRETREGGWVCFVEAKVREPSTYS